jgi:hypothetical protein
MEDRIKNFKGKRHEFTSEDRKKGGLSRSDKKRLASKTNAIKSAQHTKDTKYCADCKLYQFCPRYNPGQPCSIINHKNFKKLMHVKGFRTTEEFDDFVFDLMQDLNDPSDDDKSFYVLFNRVNELLDIKDMIR